MISHYWVIMWNIHIFICYFGIWSLSFISSLETLGINKTNEPKHLREYKALGAWHGWYTLILEKAILQDLFNKVNLHQPRRHFGPYLCRLQKIPLPILLPSTSWTEQHLIRSKHGKNMWGLNFLRGLIAENALTEHLPHCTKKKQIQLCLTCKTKVT